MTESIRGEMRQRVRDGFSILLPATDAVRLFGENLKLLRITVVPQENRRPRLTINLLEQTDEGTSSVNITTDREVAPESMKFGCTFPCTIQTIWESDPYKGPTRVSKLDVMDTYHCGTLWPSQVGAFTYVIPSISDNDCIITCIDLVLPIGWVDSSKFFCMFSETLTYVANTLVHMLIPVPG